MRQYCISDLMCPKHNAKTKIIASDYLYQSPILGVIQTNASCTDNMKQSLKKVKACIFVCRFICSTHLKGSQVWHELTRDHSA